MRTFFKRIHQLRKGLYILSGGKSLLANVGRFIGVVLQRLRENFGGHPLVGQTVVEHVGSVNGLFHYAALPVLGEDLVHAVRGLLDSSCRNSGFEELCLKLHRRHIGILNGFPVNQLNIARRQRLGKVIHGPGSLVGVSAGNSSYIADALDGGHGVVQLDAGVCEFTDVGGHIRKRINRSIGISIELIQLLVDLIQALASAGHNGLDGAHLQLILVKAGGNRFNCERRKHPFSRVYRGVGDVGKSSHSHDFKRREFRSNGLDGIAKSRQVTLLSGGAQALQALSSTVQIQTLFEFVEC